MNRRDGPKVYRVDLTPRAKADVAGAARFIRPDSPQNAIAMAARLLDAAAALSMFPRAHRVVRPNRRPGRVIRSVPCKPYVIYFRVGERAGVVQVLTFRHGAMLPPTRFPVN